MPATSLDAAKLEVLMSELQDIARTITMRASPGMKPKDLFKAVRKDHPRASKKAMRRAAFYAMILAAEADPERAKTFQELALDGGDDAFTQA